MKKIIFTSYTFEKGGAAKAANNILECINKNKNQIKRYSHKNLINNNFFSFLKVLLLNLFFKTISKNKKKISFNLFEINNFNHICKNYDIVHLHWIGNEFISLKEIIRINKKIIWTVHDDWLKNIITHVGQEDDKNYFPISYFKKKIISYKKKLFKKKIVFIAPSNYILNNLKKKTRNKIYLIRHPVNEKIFKYKKKRKSQLITFNIGGSNVFYDKNKGSEYINKILNFSKKIININYRFIFFGSKTYSDNFKIDNKIILNSYLKSKQIAEIIKHKKNGFLLKRNDKDAIKNFIRWIKKNKNFFNRYKISKDANIKFSYKSISKKYNDIYESL